MEAVAHQNRFDVRKMLDHLRIHRAMILARTNMTAHVTDLDKAVTDARVKEIDEMIDWLTTGN